MTEKPVIVISATRFFQGGTIVIVNDCLRFLSEHYSDKFRIKALVYKKELFEPLPGIEWEEFPKSRKAVWYRLYYEYYYFHHLSVKWQPILWLSLQDSTPYVKAGTRAVYFHNPLLLKPASLKLWQVQLRLSMLWLLYKYVYTKGINRNNFVFTQQEHIADHLAENYVKEPGKITVFSPKKALIAEMLSFDLSSPVLGEKKKGDHRFTFIFPATAFFYKNFQLILKAAAILEEKGLAFLVWLTLDGSENAYARDLLVKGRKFSSIQFLGFLRRAELMPLYKEADCMLFPSFLESWGLPLTEFSQSDKPILCADLPYGREALAAYNKVIFFEPDNEHQLADLMESAISGTLKFKPHPFQEKWNRIHSWSECFELMLAKKQGRH